MLIIVRFKPEKQTGNTKGKDIRIDSGSTIIKLFKDVLLKDLEILFPNSRIVMSLKDKLILGIPAIAGGILLLVIKVIPALVVTFLIISAFFGVKGSINRDQLKQQAVPWIFNVTTL